MLGEPNAPVSQANRESADFIRLKCINYILSFLAAKPEIFIRRLEDLKTDKVNMNLLGWVLFVALEISLVDYASTSTCQKLNTTLLSDCTKAGYNVTELNPSRTQEELSGLISAMRSKFKNCSSLSSLMTCSVQLPKCPTQAPKKPCKEACKNFVSGCQNRSVENDGLIALFRGICEHLPSKNCLPTPNNVTNSALGK